MGVECFGSKQMNVRLYSLLWSVFTALQQKQLLNITRLLISFSLNAVELRSLNVLSEGCEAGGGAEGVEGRVSISPYRNTHFLCEQYQEFDTKIPRFQTL